MRVRVYRCTAPRATEECFGDGEAWSVDYLLDIRLQQKE
eukprot:SAG25_NODE_11217_length_310_cov_1.208531_1_plen_38_part_10